MRALLTCVGHNDPYSVDNDGMPIPGPIFTLLEEIPCDVLYLFHESSEAMNRRASHVAIKAREVSDSIQDVAHVAFEVDDPTDYYSLFRAMRYEVEEVLRHNPDTGAEYAIQIHSGTPQMQWVWLTLAQHNVIPATVYGLHPRFMQKYNPPYSYKIDLAELGIEASPEVTELRRRVVAMESEMQAIRAENVKLSLDGSDWPGAIDVEHLPEDFRLLDYLRSEKIRLMAAALSKCPDNAADAARLLGMKEPAFRRAAADLGLRSRQRPR